MELEKVVQKSVNDLVSSGKFEEMINNHLSKTVDEIVKDALRSYGDFGKQIKDAVNECLKIDLSTVKMLDLSVVINKTITEQIQNSVNENILESVKESVKEITGELDKKEWKISEVIDKLKASAESWDRDGNSEITIIAEEKTESYGKYTHYYFDYKSDVDKYSCAFQLDLKLNKETNLYEVYNFKGGSLNKAKENDIRFQPIFGSFEKFLFRLYASKCVIINDSNDIDCYYESDWD